ncbi:hypothetical protein ASPZODRAFT_26951 [Penicilliopsis zonata CBS 506.65]|uniref:Sorting nexin MVP1 n=1 Tax=Penicilliopsis zonata CBS 506.65 TaxID=1073090 RepID=A0A1L9SCK6_9EURO|nr:hypothetical protein ASPZODRAFT_26951 [Penicilliopsis zonata CBS 506.65]OJJ44911.1 hypothetical protein ASPZODRAFT_26951 [Penicilliopsis zonata CBS 506.65]
MAMGHGEQRTLFPFFGKDYPVSYNQPPQPAISADTRDASTHLEGLPNIALPDVEYTAPFEDDPNSDRRKRRKTETAGGELQGHGTPLIDMFHEPSEQEDLMMFAGDAPSETKPPEQRTLKLNPNGKLLSSPVSKKVGGDKAQKKTGKRGRPATGKSAGEKKLVVLKYNSSAEDRGKLIDDILHGRQRHVVSKPSCVPVSAEKQPPVKATHPFFIKKTLDKPASELVTQRDSSRPTDQDSTSSQPIAKSSPFSSFRPRPRFPEPVEALWPPKELTNVEDETRQPVFAAFDPLEVDQKKAKVAVVQVDDKENVLLSRLGKTRFLRLSSTSPDTVSQVLRIPQRHVASGRVLCQALRQQLSEATSNLYTTEAVLPKKKHAAIRKLECSLDTSLSAFDRGEFESSLWIQKYAPSTAAEVLQTGPEALMLRDWLSHLTISAVDRGKPATDGDKAKSKVDGGKRSKRRKKSDKLDGFIVNSDEENSEMDEVDDPEEDELAGGVTVSLKRTVVRSGDVSISAGTADKGRVCNTILLSGPSGCGKTASVYAAAKELDFEVFEINPGSRRSAKDILERVGDMTQNHLVHHANPFDDTVNSQQLEKQDKMTGFFKSKMGRKNPEPENDPKKSRSQKQSLILFEEADILFDEDRQFWSCILGLVTQSRRPIIITCNDESLIPLEDISFHAILRFRPPPADLAIDCLLLVAAHEGHMLTRDAVRELYSGSNRDFRKSMMDLNYWCQIGVGSQKSGLDWIVDRWPRGSDVDQHGDPLRAISLRTYQRFMGWFNRDITLGAAAFEGEEEYIQDSLRLWQLSVQDSELLAPSREREASMQSRYFQAKSPLERLDVLSDELLHADLRSDLDILGSRCSLEQNKDAVDFSAPPLKEGYKANFVEGYTLLHTDLQPDYSQTAVSISTAFGGLISTAFRHPRTDDDREEPHAARVLMKAAMSQSVDRSKADFLNALEPLAHADHLGPLPAGRIVPSFASGMTALCEDLAPYIRSIMAFDLRLEQYRLQLSGLLSQGSAGTKRMRKTRASRAALEGGDKAFTRKERWFPTDANPAQILATGGHVWQEVLVQLGHFTVAPIPESSNGLGDDTSEASHGELPVGPLMVVSAQAPRHPLPSLSLAADTHRIRRNRSAMSLFGTSPDESGMTQSGQKSKLSLFADDPNPSSSLFADDDDDNHHGGDDHHSPWTGNGTVKKAARHELVKTLLPASQVPESYIDAYDAILNSGDRVGPGIGLTSIKEVLSGSGISAADQAKILDLVVPTNNTGGLGRGEFNVLLALIGLAQQDEELTLDAVDDHRRKLPEPKSTYIDRLKEGGENQRPATPPVAPVQEPASVRSQRSRRDSLGGFEQDPWGSPQLHRGHSHTQQEQDNAAQPALNGYGTTRSATNAWNSHTNTIAKKNQGITIKSDDEATLTNTYNGDGDGEYIDSRAEAGGVPSSVGSGWGSYNPSSSPAAAAAAASSAAGFGPATGFGPPAEEEQPAAGFQARPLGIIRAVGPQVEEVVTVTLLPEKEGMFMFQHRNYEVKSARRGSTVVRRYSDFVWLLDCLQKRFPFRQLPLLPPKRVAVNGTHLSADSTSFLEKRRRGLVRFVNALVRHPVLSQEQLVVMFLTVPTELSVWRKQATISVQDEFSGRALPPDLEDSLPGDLTETFDTVRSGVKRSAEIYINLCTLLERLAKRNEGLAADHLRFSLALQSLTTVTPSTYAVDTNDIALLNEGIHATARHLSTSQSLLEDEARAWHDGVLEDLKRQRDCLVSMRELFDRRDRYARHNIPQLERRIESNKTKLEDLRARPQGTAKPGEMEKLEDAIFKDNESIVQQHTRGVFIKECIRDELLHFQQSQYHISRLHQDWSQERVKYSELQADNWRSLSEEVEGMPMGE